MGAKLRKVKCIFNLSTWWVEFKVILTTQQIQGQSMLYGGGGELYNESHTPHQNAILFILPSLEPAAQTHWYVESLPKCHKNKLNTWAKFLEAKLIGWSSCWIQEKSTWRKQEAKKKRADTWHIRHIFILPAEDQSSGYLKLGLSSKRNRNSPRSPVCTGQGPNSYLGDWQCAPSKASGVIATCSAVWDHLDKPGKISAWHY